MRPRPTSWPGSCARSTPETDAGQPEAPGQPAHPPDYQKGPPMDTTTVPTGPVPHTVESIVDLMRDHNLSDPTHWLLGYIEGAVQDLHLPDAVKVGTIRN